MKNNRGRNYGQVKYNKTYRAPDDMIMPEIEEILSIKTEKICIYLTMICDL
jgi:hypothetical protein